MKTILQVIYNDCKEAGESLSFAVEGVIELKPGDNGNYTLVLKPHSDVYCNWNNTKINVVLSPEQLVELTGLSL